MTSKRMRRRTLLEGALVAIENGDAATAAAAIRKSIAMLVAGTQAPRNGAKEYARERMRCPKCRREVARCADGSPHAHHRLDDGVACVVAGGTR